MNIIEKQIEKIKKKIKPLYYEDIPYNKQLNLVEDMISDTNKLKELLLDELEAIKNL